MLATAKAQIPIASRALKEVLRDVAIRSWHAHLLGIHIAQFSSASPTSGYVAACLAVQPRSFGMVCEK